MSRLEQFAVCAFTILTFVHIIVAFEETAQQTKIISPSQFLNENCACAADFDCYCCRPVGMSLWNLKPQNLCANWTISKADWRISTNINLAGSTLLTRTFTGQNIPPLCFPLATIPLFACLKLHSLELHDSNDLHACANFSLRFITFDFMEMMIGCFDIGANGFKIVDPSHHLTETETTTAAGTEITLESIDSFSEKEAAAHSIVPVDKIKKQFLQNSLKFKFAI